MKRLIVTAGSLAIIAAIAFGAQIFAAIGTPEERLDVLEPQQAELLERVLTLEGKANTYTGSIGSEAAAPRTNIKILEHTASIFITGALITGIVRSDDPFPVEFVEITAIVRLAVDGSLLATGSGFADKNPTLPGETSTFTILVSANAIADPLFGGGGQAFTYELEVTDADRDLEAATTP
jgi:hypothetical protein